MLATDASECDVAVLSVSVRAYSIGRRAAECFDLVTSLLLGIQRIAQTEECQSVWKHLSLSNHDREN